MASAVFAGGFAACGGGSSAPVTATANPTAALTMPASPTPEPTKSALQRDAPEVTQVLALSGFPEFARQFAAAVAANDTQFFIDRGYVHSETCNGGGMNGIPCPTGQKNVPVDVILVGAWNSEGDYYTADRYDKFVRDYLSAATSPDATPYALGHEVRFQGETEDGVDILVSGIGFPPPSNQPFDPRFSINFQVQRIDGAWRITRLDRASTDLLPDFFDWWVPWDEAFPQG